MVSPTLQTYRHIVFVRMRVLFLASLSITWLIASLVPHYSPTIKEHIQTRLSEARQRIPAVRIDWRPLGYSDDESYPQDPRERFNESKVALLIEARPIPHLVPQILHMISIVPPDWRFVFVGSNASVASVARSYATKHQQAVGKLDLLVLPPPWEIETKEKVHRSRRRKRIPGDRFSGNGGLSFRRVSTIKRVLRFQERYNDTTPEDEWFGTRLWVLPGAKVASGEKGGQLAVEDVYMDEPMGFHVREGGLGGSQMAEDVWKDPQKRKQIFDYCPELSLIMDMKLERERCENDNLDGTLRDLNNAEPATPEPQPAPEPASTPMSESVPFAAAVPAEEGGVMTTTTSIAEGGGGG